MPSALLRERAKAIPGRKFNPNKKCWYFKKDIDAYENIKNEFFKDSSVFEIRKPETKEKIKIPDSSISKKEEKNYIYDDEFLKEEILAIKEEINSFKKVDLEQTQSIKIISQQLVEQFSLKEKVNVKNKAPSRDDSTLKELFSWGIESNEKKVFEDLGFELNFNDHIGAINILHQRLEENLFILLDIPNKMRINYDLFKLLEESKDLGVVGSFDINNLHNFRKYRNLCGHGTRGANRIILSQSKMKVAAAVAILSLALSWGSTLKK